MSGNVQEFGHQKKERCEIKIIRSATKLFDLSHQRGMTFIILMASRSYLDPQRFLNGMHRSETEYNKYCNLQLDIQYRTINNAAFERSLVGLSCHR